ncbi:MAG: NYN domain-containing protein [Treponemataceae bacterium]|nr:NYN domain-containing protein [Treponemataceae bacterium]HOK00140.1 NYN domain-containing protein [Termitinemataceae bacterium]HOM24391.1 NYN domain-containing protein [Termitinemataceae bacterium]HPQ01478.1 NYN domain-containing protein [Termitinemataceae bacterium]
MPLYPYPGPSQNGGPHQAKLAVLIDADNTQPAIIEGLLNEVAKYGVASVKRIYGDWTSNNLRSWKDKLLEYAIQPIQQFSYTTGKNATDSAMIIDAMDLLYTEKLDGFCIVSSDSDFTRLAARIRESGLIVYGFGEKKTPKAFVAACDKFIYTEILKDQQEEEDELESKPAPKPGRDIKGDRRLITLLRNAVEDLADESGWAYLGSVGQSITNRSSEFDPRNYGFKKLGDLFRALPQFEIDERPQENGPGRQVYIRWKRRTDKR